jgi:hypothetical protein
VIRIEFTKEEMQMIETEAHQRNSAIHTSYNDDGWETLGGETRLHRNIQGRIGEHAGARILGIAVQPATLPAGTDDGIDAVYRGKTIEYKFNPYSFGDFYIKKIKQFNADIGILTTPIDGKWYRALRVFAIRKWVTRDIFERYSVEKSFGYADKKVIAISQDKMLDIELLVNCDSKTQMDGYAVKVYSQRLKNIFYIISDDEYREDFKDDIFFTMQEIRHFLEIKKVFPDMRVVELKRRIIHD